MNVIFDLLRQKERKVLALLCILLTLAGMFYVFVARGMKGSYLQSAAALTAKRQKFEELDLVRKEKKAEWRQWRLALKDMEDLRTGNFYTAETVSQEMMRDIAQIFQNIGLPVPEVRFTYVESTDQRRGGALAIFQFSGPYALIKRFIHGIEHFPRFLVLDQIDFMDIQRQSGALRLKVTLAGYYED
jgi:Tfp pilus assembly protein PilO